MGQLLRRCFVVLLALLVTVTVAGLSSADAAGWSKATPSSLEQTGATSTSVAMKWKAVSGAPRYRLQVSTKADMSGSRYYQFKGTSGTVSGLTKATKYFVKVRVITTAGDNLSAYSSAVEALTAFSTPSSLTVTSSSDGSLGLGWKSVSGAPRYRIQLSKSSAMSNATYHRFWSNSGSIAGLDPGAKYFAKVRVISSTGLNLSSYSASPVSGTAGSASRFDLPAPTGLRSTAQATSMLALDWDDVTGAPAYTLLLSRSSSMTTPVTRTVSTSAAQLGGLSAGVTYYARVRAAEVEGTPLSEQSTVLTVKTPTTGFSALAPSGLAAGAMESTSAPLSWSEVEGATNYRVQYSKAADMSGANYVRSVATTQSVEGLDADTTYYFKVRVIDADGGNLSDYSAAVKASTTVAAVPMKVASYNVRCANCYAGTNTELKWVDRRAHVVQNIKSRMPDVIGIQEASQGWLSGTNISQFEDLRTRLRAAGTAYEVTDLDRNNCVKSTTPSSCKYKDQGASQGTKVFYNTTTVEKISSGSKMLPQCSGCNDRYVAWGIFTYKATGKKFFFADTHLEPGSDKYSIRQSQAVAMMAEIAKQNVDRLPVFVVGDLNSTRYFSPANAPYDKIVATGLVDPLGHTYKSAAISLKATAEKRLRANYNSFNDFSRTLTKYADNQNGSNIDYIFTSPMRTLEWETVLTLDDAGRLSGVVPSDHNMIMATVVMP